MEHGIFYVVVGLASICFFLLGKYVFPQAAGAINNALTMLESYPLLMKWGDAACRYIKQYFDSMTGEEKNKKAADIIMELAKQAGIKITEEQARSIAQAAYDAMKRGESDSAHEGQVSSDAES